MVGSYDTLNEPIEQLSALMMDTTLHAFSKRVRCSETCLFHNVYSTKPIMS
jgi:hypothetical protein